MKNTANEKKPPTTLKVFVDMLRLLWAGGFRKAIVMIIICLPILYYINVYLSEKFEWKELASPVDLLLPTIFSVSVAFASVTLITSRFYPEIETDDKLSYIDGIVRLNIWASLFFTSAIIFLVFDIFPIPKPTQRWIWIWAIFFIIGWVGQFLVVLFITQSKIICGKK